MSAIITYFFIKTTRKQAHQIDVQWKKHQPKKPGAMMLVMQPIGVGPFQEFREFKCGILDVKLAKALSSTVEKHRSKRP